MDMFRHDPNATANGFVLKVIQETVHVELLYTSACYKRDLATDANSPESQERQIDAGNFVKIHGEP